MSEDFPSHNWPISGGWGYTQEDAVVIETENSAAGVSLEYKFLEYRTYEEMIIFRPKGQRYAGFRFKREMQSLHCPEESSKQYDKVEMTVTCFKEEDFEMLKADWESHNGYIDDDEGRTAHLELNEKKKITFKIIGWFDITKFFGKY